MANLVFGSVASQSVRKLINAVESATCRCPAHSQQFSARSEMNYTVAGIEKEYAFEMACSNIRYGENVIREVGMDFLNMRAKRVCVITDAQVAKLPVMATALEALHRSNIHHDVFDRARIEPSDSSFQEAIAFAMNSNFDAFLAIGGGSAMDTCKAANLYSSKPEAEFLDYVNAPLGRGLPVTHDVKPLIAIPTTAGTGSETTGVAIFDYEPLKAKTGIGSRVIRPTLGLVDPLLTLTMPERVAANSGFDVLCHALESYTAIPYNERTPRPADPKERPAYQGSNPISDVWSKQALRILAKYFKRSVFDPGDKEARSAMHLASVFAGIGFGNAGVHLCHGMSYAISGNVKNYVAKDYSDKYPIIPHGLSVVMTAPAVFNFTSPMCPERHLEAAEILGADVSNKRLSDSGRVLSDTVKRYMFDMKMDNGLKALGYNKDDIPALVKGTLPQRRVTKLSPRIAEEEDLSKLLSESMTIF